MTFYHLSDLHLGLKLINHSLQEDQKYILDKIIEYANEDKPEAIVIAGDIYDKAIPSAEAVELFDEFMSKLRSVTPQSELMLISGNHDSAPRLDVFRNILKHQKIHMIGNPPEKPEDHIEKVTLRDSFGPVNFYLLPFVKPSMVKAIVGTDQNGNNLSYNDTIHKLLAREDVNVNERNILVSHQFYLPAGKDASEIERMESEICTVGNIDQVYSDVLEPFDYAALGHIHKPMKAGSEFFRYCGTPLACSVQEAGQEKGIIRVRLDEKGKRSTEVLPLVPMRQVMVIKGSLDEVLSKGCDDFVTVILTDKVDLDVLDMQDRLRYAFPNLLEIRREIQRKADYNVRFSEEKVLNPYELCCSFLPDMDEYEQELLKDVINSVQDGGDVN
ncbi:exonuclease SbcD [Lachnospiraceae bacterium JC7]|nr:exonuclease SbcD [Lachnospiraceae bacterium JC7]